MYRNVESSPGEQARIFEEEEEEEEEEEDEGTNRYVPPFNESC
jgi:hypothetical protein